MDGEIYHEASVAGGYFNEDNLRLAASPLPAVGLTRDDGDLSFETHPGPEGAEGIYLLGT